MPKPPLGQNFLVDRAVVARIVAALELQADEALLEIGPGRGALTGALLRAGVPTVAVELDRRLAERLRERFDSPRLVVLREDILAVRFEALLERLGRAPGDRLVVVGNLPYLISKPIVRQLIRERRRVARAVLMFQREVAERLTAAPGCRAYGPLTVLAGRAFRVRRLFDVPARAFRPAPRVASSVTAWRPREAEALDAATESRLRRCLAVAFARRRRTLRNNLRAALADGERVEAVLRAAAIDGGLRAEALGEAQLLRLAHALEREGGAAPGSGAGL